MAGYSFHFDLPKTENMPLDAYISSILPDEMRIPKEYRDELYKLKKVMGIKTPILFKKAPLHDDVHAVTHNTGFLHWEYSLIHLGINECSTNTLDGMSWNKTQ